MTTIENMQITFESKAIDLLHESFAANANIVSTVSLEIKYSMLIQSKTQFALNRNFDTICGYIECLHDMDAISLDQYVALHDFALNVYIELGLILPDDD